jgi:hypothetical protein
VIRYSIPLVTAALVVSACGGAGFKSYEPVAEKTSLDQDQLFTAAQRTIEKLGYQPVKFDRAGHTVSTREKEVGYSSVPRLSYRYSFTIETQGGQLSITVSCTMNDSLNREKFEDCGDERPDRVLDEMEALRAEILETGKKVPKGPTYDEPVDESELPAKADATEGEPPGKTKKDETAKK